VNPLSSTPFEVSGTEKETTKADPEGIGLIFKILIGYGNEYLILSTLYYILVRNSTTVKVVLDGAVPLLLRSGS